MDRNGKIYSYHPIVKAQDYMKYNVQNFVEFWGLSPAEMMKNYLQIRGSTKKERDEVRAYIAKLEIILILFLCEKSGSTHFLTFFVLAIKIKTDFGSINGNKKKGRLEE